MTTTDSRAVVRATSREHVEIYGEDEAVNVTVDDEYGPVFVEWYLSGTKAERESALRNFLCAL